MKSTIIAGNWKMYKDIRETTELIDGLKSQLKSGIPTVTVVVCPPFTSLLHAAGLIKGSPLKLGAQNMSQHDEGAYTGEISWKMLVSAGCEYVILGHSERRQYFHETNELVNLKARKALAQALRPIICVGETLQERESGMTAAVIEKQIAGVLNGLSAEEIGRCVIAYEPVWAIGTGKNATPAQAQEVHAQIRTLLTRQFNSQVAGNVPIQYGGSVKPDNAAELLAQNDINGALVGGACLKVDSFMSIIKSARI